MITPKLHLRERPRTIIPFTTPVTVSTETPIQALTVLGSTYMDLALTLRNHDAVNRAAFYIEQSESGVVTDADREVVYIEPLKERTFEFRDVLRTYWGLSAAGDPDAGFPSVQVSFKILGRLWP